MFEHQHNSTSENFYRSHGMIKTQNVVTLKMPIKSPTGYAHGMQTKQQNLCLESSCITIQMIIYLQSLKLIYIIKMI